MSSISPELAALANKREFSVPNDDLPTLEVSSSVEFMMFRAMDSVRRALEHTNSADATPFNMTMFLINTVPDTEWRRKTISKFNEMRKKYGIESITCGECHLLCAMICGEVVDWQTKFRGSVKRLEVGTV